MVSTGNAFKVYVSAMMVSLERDAKKRSPNVPHFMEAYVLSMAHVTTVRAHASMAGEVQPVRGP